MDHSASNIPPSSNLAINSLHFNSVDDWRVFQLNRIIASRFIPASVIALAINMLSKGLFDDLIITKLMLEYRRWEYQRREQKRIPAVGENAPC